MMKAQRKPPTSQRVFGSAWVELDYLCKKIRFWLYQRRSPASARRYLGRLEQLTRALPRNEEAILKQEGLALVHELKGHFELACRYREREIELMEKLHGDAKHGDYKEETRAYMLSDRGADALRERREILARLNEQLCRVK